MFRLGNISVLAQQNLSGVAYLILQSLLDLLILELLKFLVTLLITNQEFFLAKFCRRGLFLEILKQPFNLTFQTLLVKL